MVRKKHELVFSRRRRPSVDDRAHRRPARASSPRSALIVAIGAQNAFVLRQGIRREHVLAVVAVCAVADALLIAAGIAGLGAPGDRPPGGADGRPRYGGAAFLLVLAVGAALRARRPERLDPAADGARSDAPRSCSPCLALHVPQPARLPGHRRAARVAGQPARTPAAGCSAPGAVRRERHLVHRARLRRAPAAPGVRPAARPGRCSTSCIARGDGRRLAVTAAASEPAGPRLSGPGPPGPRPTPARASRRPRRPRRTPGTGRSRARTTGRA